MERCKLTPQILNAFGIAPDAPSSLMDGGHINDTYLVEAGAEKVVLQRINKFVFPSPEHVMENFSGVTGFLREKITAQGGDPARETLTVLPASDGRAYYLDEAGEYWRCVAYIGGTVSYETPESLAMLREAGRAFGGFQRMLGEYPAHTLHEIIPHFHDTPDRFRQLEEAMARDAKGRRKDVAPELRFAGERKASCGLLMGLLEAGKLPLRVTHNDTKMSNILMDPATGKAVCVIDLDTVMPGLCAFDFGDSIRAGATTAAEDETDLSKVLFDTERFEAYAEGFLSAAGSTLTDEELRTLPDGAILMTFEVGIRFLADYLNGDVYFHTAYPAHNLDRARNQFKLVEEMERQRGEMDAVIAKYR